MNQQSNKSSKIAAQEIKNPQGGGAINSLGETFEPHEFSGSGSFSIPLPITGARGLQPNLSLNYSSGSGNGIFGMGFSLNLSKISIRTEKGLPLYDDQDVYLLDGGELVVEKDSTKIEGDYQVTEYLPRIVSEFITIKHYVLQTAVTDKVSSYWSVTSNDGTEHIYGQSAATQIADPNNQKRVFEWCIESTTDLKGNKIAYEYKQEDSSGAHNVLCEQRVKQTTNGEVRDGSNAQKYIKKIYWGNYFAGSEGDEVEKYAYQLIFDYGEHNISNLSTDGSNPYQEVKDWDYRPDAFSAYKSRFEIRTKRLCKNVLLFHDFEELGAISLVKALSVTYQVTTHSNISIAQSIKVTGYRRKGLLATKEYEELDLPQIDLGFSKFLPPANPAFNQLTATDNNIPGYLNTGGFLPIDFNQEGIAGLLYQTHNGMMYLEPEGEGKYSKLETIEKFPVDRDLTTGKAMLSDIEGNGQLDLVVKDGLRKGFYQKRDIVNNGQPHQLWDNYQDFKACPTDEGMPYMESADLAGNGRTDKFFFDIAQDTETSQRATVTVRYPSIGKDGYQKSERIINAISDFPLIKRGYKQEYVGFANIFGDGMPHRIRIARSEDRKQLNIECWPSLGYGYFGDKITLDSSIFNDQLAEDPNFVKQFDASRLFLADIDGSGTIDLIYAYADHVKLYVNQNGNSFAEPITVELPTHYSNIDQISFADILGNGTTCMVITKIAPKVEHYYYNFIGVNTDPDIVDPDTRKVIKPYLLNEINNNLGAITKLNYTSSTEFYLKDKKAGKPWLTPLPFPVQVIKSSTHINLITKAHFTSLYKYHNGYYDHQEREFKGFAFIERWDSEEYKDYTENSTPGEHDYQSLQEKYYVPPTYTKTWYHTGIDLTNKDYLDYFKAQYYQGDNESYNFPNDIFDPEIGSADELTKHQANTALSGKVLRSEVYFDDKDQHPELASHPLTVSESNLEVRLYQTIPSDQDINPANIDRRFAVFQIVPRESISYHYERNPEDPRIEQSFTLQTDNYGNDLLSCHIFLPRRDQSDANIQVYSEQQAIKAVLSKSTYVTPLENDMHCHVACEGKSMELVNLEHNTGYFEFEVLSQQIKALGIDTASNIVAYGEDIAPNAGLKARLLSWHKSYFWNKGQTDDLPLKKITDIALLHHQEEAVFTNDNLQEAFDGRLSDEILKVNGGYIWDEITGYWWNKGLTQYYYQGQNKFYLPYSTDNSFVSTRSSLNIKSTTDYDNYYLAPIQTQSYLNDDTFITTIVEIDYITMQVKRSIDTNDNILEFLFDPLGQVIVTSHYGTETNHEGNLTYAGGVGLYTDRTIKVNGADKIVAKYQPAAGIPTFNKILQSPEDYIQGASTYYYYNLNAWTEQQQPASSISMVRKDHYLAKETITEDDCQIQIVYSDGFGQVLETKHKEAAGISFIRLADSELKTDNAGNVVEENSTVRWRTSGKTVYNNKNMPVEQYLPYFINSPDYEDQKDIPSIAPTVTHYDPLGRVLRVDTPKGFFTKVEFTPWETKHFDENDTVLDSEYFQQNFNSLPPYDQAALDKSVAHYNTPSIAVLDNRGETFLGITNNLGIVSTNTFTDKGIDNNTAIAIYDYLLDNQYIYIESKDVPPIGTINLSFLTNKFRPYNRSFTFDNLPTDLQQYNQQIIDVLKQNCLTEYNEIDILGRNTFSIDARLYYQNQSQNEEYYNFQYLYPMNSKTPFYSNSVDAGIEKHLSNIYGHNIFSWTARDYCQISDYDNLQRKILGYVKKIDTPGPITDYNDFAIVEDIFYGENETDAKDKNLYGKAFEIRDSSGVKFNDRFDFTSKLQEHTCQIIKDYKEQIIDWYDVSSVALEDEIYTNRFVYNAIGEVLEEITPDNSVTTRSYDIAGKLMTTQVWYKSQYKIDLKDGKSKKDIRNIIQSIIYDKNNQRSQVTYGNGIITNYQYEPTTLRLRSIVSSTSSANAAEKQNLVYYYDPVGNITNLIDNSAETVFNNNQVINPESDYIYDALYRLTTATGRMHSEVVKNIKAGGTGNDKYTKSISVNDANQLENYTEYYTYDDAGNLIKKQRTAATASNNLTKDLPVADNSNRIASTTYDANGNMLDLSAEADNSNVATLDYNWRNELSSAKIIARESQPDDAEYYVYDQGGMRVRKTNEKLVSSTITNIEDKFYIGNYEVRRKTTIQNQEHTGEAEGYFLKNTLRIMDGDTCVATLYDWEQDARQQEVAPNTPARTHYHLANNLGSVTLELSETGETISYEEYFPYGGTSYITGKTELDVKAKEYRYSGKERDDTTGLYYYGARYYAPWMARWITTDPAKRVDGMGLYQYVSGNPIIYIDPTGMVKKHYSPSNDRTLTKAQGNSGRFVKKGAADFRSPSNPTKNNYSSGYHEAALTTDHYNYLRTVSGTGGKRTLPNSSKKVFQSFSKKKIDVKTLERIVHYGDSIRTDTAQTILAAPGDKVAGHSGSGVKQTGQSYAHDVLRQMTMEILMLPHDTKGFTDKSHSILNSAMTVTSIAPGELARTTNSNKLKAAEVMDKWEGQRNLAKARVEKSLSTSSPAEQQFVQSRMGRLMNLLKSTNRSIAQGRATSPLRKDTLHQGDVSGGNYLPAKQQDSLLKSLHAKDEYHMPTKPEHISLLISSGFRGRRQ